MMTEFTFRKARKEDVFAIVNLLADDDLGAQRERATDPLPETYYAAFERIERDPNQELIVIDKVNEGIVGTFQMSFIPYLTYQGGTRAQIEAVRIREDLRGKGVGEMFVTWAVSRAREREVHVLQLTTDKQRPRAVKFYEKLGFTASHEGMKMHLKNP